MKYKGTVCNIQTHVIDPIWGKKVLLPKNGLEFYSDLMFGKRKCLAYNMY